ncbi:efflux RND transporter periplasmic adaptor subunit [Bryobacter aggregatus]|uniref:efflux RND transporter periplasmic adaptor subunit n=1 Tax=Bryobacter aggregatus TaxID=360054 RepID=UPI0004E19495|nr:efflux RND transporter periplasmic adaptor subunit [Bryobacter aggregatus]
MKRFGVPLLGLLVILAAVVAWQLNRETPRVPTQRLARGVFEDQVTTNGRVEPSEWASARAEREGLIIQVPVTKGQRVSKGTPLAILDSKDAQADLASAVARIEEARSSIQTLEDGGRKRDLVEIEEGLKQRQAEKSQAEKDLAVAERLAARNAGTQEDVRNLKDKIELITLQIAALNARRPALVGASDLVSAKARLREAQSAAELARRRIELSTVRSPGDGVVYQLDAKVGSYVNPGALVANVGEVSTLKVLVFVDEPELGRVHQNMPVSITWDALEGKTWRGHVDKVPTQIVPLGTRQVGEVECRIANANGDLLPGTNVNVTVQTRKQEGVLLVPKEAIRNRDGEAGVWVVQNGALHWKKVETGAGNITNAIVLQGLQEGEVVVLGPETNLKAGAKVKT